jgi:hypothetical protein
LGTKELVDVTTKFFFLGKTFGMLGVETVIIFIEQIKEEPDIPEISYQINNCITRYSHRKKILKIFFGIFRKDKELL